MGFVPVLFFGPQRLELIKGREPQLRAFSRDERNVGISDLPDVHMPMLGILRRMLEREDAVLPECPPSRETHGRWIAVFLVGDLLRGHQVELIPEHRRVFEVRAPAGTPS